MKMGSCAYLCTDLITVVLIANGSRKFHFRYISDFVFVYLVIQPWNLILKFQILSQYTTFEPYLTEIWPKKEPARLVKCHEKIEILVVNHEESEIKLRTFEFWKFETIQNKNITGSPFSLNSATALGFLQCVCSKRFHFFCPFRS